MRAAHVERQREYRNQEFPAIPSQIPPMSPPGLDGLSLAIGALQADVKTLTKSLDEERANATQHRQALRETIAALSEAVRALTAEVASMKPIVEDYREKASQARGRARLGRILMGLWMAIAGCATALVTWALSHWKGVLIPAAVLILAGAALAVGGGR